MTQANILFDKDLERVVLGAILLEKSAIARVGFLFRPEMFYVGQNEVTANAILKAYKAGIPIDLTTIWTEIRKSKNEHLITAGELAGYTRDVVSSANLEVHMAKLAELYLSREVQKMAGKAYGTAGDWAQDPFEMINELQTNLTNLLAGTMQGGLIGIDRLITGTLRYIESLKPDMVSGIETGLTDLDNIFYGFKPQELVIIAARPSCGKTAFALQTMRYSASKQKKMAFFSLEMSANKILQRNLAAISGLHFAKIQRNHLQMHEWDILNDAAANLAKLPIYIDDSFSQSVQVLHSKCTQMKFRHGLDGVMVDYLQLIGSAKNSKPSNREQAIAGVSRELKGMAKDLNVPVIALSQMSRDIEKGGRKEPVLSDLRESGAIEQDADIVLFLTPEESDNEQFGATKIVNAKVAKNRDGAKDTVQLEFDGNFMRFNKPGYDTPIPGNWKPIRDFTEPKDAPF
jgi:replicative DNA helicase